MKNFKKGIVVLVSILALVMYGCGQKTSSDANNKPQAKKEIQNETKKETKKEIQKEDKKETSKESISSKEKDNEFPKGTPLKYNDEGVCILMYHSIDYEKNNNLRMPKEKFREQMKYIKEQGYTTLTLDQLYDFYAKNKPIPKKSVVITLDDGYADNYTNAYPILKEYGIKATIFVVTDCIDRDKSCLTSKQIKELQANGIDIESHTTNHQELNRNSYEKQLEALKKSKEVLEKILDKKVNYIAYPCGKYNETTIKAAKEAGYTMAFATGGRFGKKSDGIYGIKRIGVYANNGMDVIKGNLKSN